jgi:NAD(P)H-hydrate epimerase
LRKIAVRQIRSIPKLPPRRRDAHKGDFGRVLIIGGSRGMIGAPSLAANAALRAGAGLVTVACPESIQLAVATLCPCATTIPLPDTRAGVMNPLGAAQELATLGLFNEKYVPSVIAAGPGLGRGGEEFEGGLLKLWNAFAFADVPLVLDADAINALHKSGKKDGGGWNQEGWTRTVITPHPGELARMQGVTIKEIQADRQGWAVRTAREMAGRMVRASGPRRAAPRDPPVVVLKGAGTIVTDGQRVYVNKTGNPGMATGGAGDVLTGVIAALVGQGLSCFDAAVLGVHVHGVAGDLAAKNLGEASIVATDIIDHLSTTIVRRQ